VLPSASEQGIVSPQGRADLQVHRSGEGHTANRSTRCELLGFQPLCTSGEDLFKGLPTSGEGQVYEGMVSGFLTSHLTTLSLPRRVSYHGEKGPGDPGLALHQGKIWGGNDQVRQSNLTSPQRHRGRGEEIFSFARRYRQIKSAPPPPAEETSLTE